MDEILDLLHYFQSPTNQRLRAKLEEITSMAIKLWSAIRKDSCRVDFDYDPSIGDWQECNFVDDMVMSGSMAVNPPSEIPVAHLPSKSFVLFLRITGSFDLIVLALASCTRVGLFLMILRPFEKVFKKLSTSTTRQRNSNVVCAGDPALNLRQ